MVSEDVDDLGSLGQVTLEETIFIRDEVIASDSHVLQIATQYLGLLDHGCLPASDTAKVQLDILEVHPGILLSLQDPELSVQASPERDHVDLAPLV